jgi:hypothetical protein
MATDQTTEVESALTVVAAKAWGVLASGDVTSAATWNEAMAWVRIGQRICGEESDELVQRVREVFPPAPMPFP